MAPSSSASKAAARHASAARRSPGGRATSSWCRPGRGTAIAPARMRSSSASPIASCRRSSAFGARSEAPLDRRPMLKVVRVGDGLAALAAFAREIPRGSWFAALGEPLTEGERAEARTYVAEVLGRNDVVIAGAADWLAAQAIIKRYDDRAWWDAEMLAQNAVRQRAETAHGKDALLAALEPIVE